MSGYYPGYPTPPAPPHQQPFYSDQQNRPNQAYNPPPPHGGPPAQTGMGFVPPPGPQRYPPGVGFNPAPPVQSGMIPPAPFGMGVGKGFQPPSVGVPGVVPPPMYSLNAAMKDMTVTGPGIASNIPGGTPSNVPMFQAHAGPQFMAPPPFPNAPQPPQVPMQGQLHAPVASQFYTPVPSASQVERRFSAGEVAGSEALAGGDGFHLDHIDTSIQVPSRMLRFSSSKLPATQSLATSSKIPFGGIIRPLSCPENDDDEDVDVIQPGAAGIVRCKRCRTYINPFVSWIENGRRWRCNICAQLNDCPSAYFCHLDPSTGQRRDTLQRPELCKSVVEWVAPSEYMVRPPQPPAYFFIFDVSGPAVQTGMLAIVSNSIRKCLDDLPGGDRTMVGFITYDTSVHYYLMKPGSDHAQMLVVGDLNELFVPAPVDLLVNLKDSRKAVDNFLDNLPTMFSGKPSPSVSCLGPALKAAFTVVKAIGGKMIVFQSILPNLGDGALKPRGSPNLMGTPDEVAMLRPSSTWYKDTAIEFSRCQIAVDLFLFPHQYIDCSTLSELPKLTSGSFFTYLAFNAKNDGQKLESQLCRTLTQPTIFEAVLRVRCTKGMKISNYYGNFFVRGTDLLALPACNADSTYAFDIVHDEQSVNSKYVSIQSALLYTSSDGERRIRVSSHVLAVTNSMSDLMASVDTEATLTLMARQASEICVKVNLDTARNRIIQTCADVFRAAKEGDKRTVSGYVVPPPGQQQRGVVDEDVAVPKNLELLPLYTLGLLKNVAIRGGTDVHPDERIAAHMLINDMFVESTITFLHPKLFTIHNMNPTVGTPSHDSDSSNEEHGVKTAGRNHIILPPSVNLSVERLSSEGIFLLDNGNDFYLWVGRASSPSINNSLFGVNSLEIIGDVNQLTLIRQGNDTASRLDSVLQALRESNLPPIASKVIIVREGDAIQESRFFWHLIEDRAQFNGGTYNYSDFVQFLNRPATSPVGIGMPGPNLGQKPHPGMSHGTNPPFPMHPSGTGHMPPMGAPVPGQMQPPQGRPAGPPPPPSYLVASQPMPSGQAPPSQYYPPGPQALVSPPSMHSMPPSHGTGFGQSPPSQAVPRSGSMPPPPMNMNPPQNSSYGAMEAQQVNRMSAPPAPAMPQRQGINAPPPVNIRAGNETAEHNPQSLQTSQVTAPPVTEPVRRDSVAEVMPALTRAPPSLPSYGYNAPSNITSFPPANHVLNAPSPITSNPVVDTKQQPSTMGPPPPPPAALAAGAKRIQGPNERPLPPPPNPPPSMNAHYPGSTQQGRH